jgi:hypothetical protein
VHPQLDTQRLTLAQKIAGKVEIITGPAVSDVLTRLFPGAIEDRGVRIAARKLEDHRRVSLLPRMVERAVEVPQVHFGGTALRKDARRLSEVKDRTLGLPGAPRQGIGGSEAPALLAACVAIRKLPHPLHKAESLDAAGVSGGGCYGAAEELHRLLHRLAVKLPFNSRRGVPMRWLYLSLAVLGTALPYSQFVPWLAEHGLHVRLLFTELFLGRVSAFFGLDAIVSALVLFVFILSEGTRRKIPLLWLPIAATCVMGASCGFPLFLYLRERQIGRSA